MFKSIKFKLIWLFVLVGAIPVLLVTFLQTRTARQSLEKKVSDQLVSIREIKKESIERYFAETRTEIKFMAENQVVISAMKELKTAFHAPNTSTISETELAELTAYYQEHYIDKLNIRGFDTAKLSSYFPKDEKTLFYQYHQIVNAQGSKPTHPYFAAHNKYHKFFTDFKKTFEYYDVFLVDNETGHLVYTVAKELDYATSLVDGPYMHTNIADLFHQVRNQPLEVIKLEDYKFYPPSYMEPALFIGCPIFDGNQNIGTLIFQLSIDRIDALMTGNKNWEKEGLGKTGESYIVGKDFKVRNNARLFFEDKKEFYADVYETTQDSSVIRLMEQLNNTILVEEVKTEAVRDALAGNAAVRTIGTYRKKVVLSAYSPLNIEGVNWVIIAEIDKAEAFEALDKAGKQIIFMMMFLLIAVIITALLIASGISKPIHQIMLAMVEISKGKFGTPVQTKSKDEIGKLAFYFNMMSKTLKDSRDRIVKSNQELKKQQDVLKKQAVEVQQKNEELLATEEELRQNIEEIMAIQEKLQANEIELRGRLNSINRTLAVMECAPDGEILDANTLFLFAVKYEKDEIVGQNHSLLMGKNFAQTRQYDVFWEELRQGVPRSGEFKIYNRYQQEVWINATYTPVHDEAGEINKIIILASDITQQKLASLEFETSQRAFVKFNAIAEIDLKGYIITVNENFTKMMGFDATSELVGKPISKFYDELAFETYSFEMFWDNLLANGSFTGEGKFINRYSQTIWLGISYSLVENIDGKPIKVILLARDITTQKQQEFTIQAQLDQITASEEELRQNQDALISINENLLLAQEKLSQQNTALIESSALIQKQSDELRHINEKIIDSINYASRIQSAVLGNPADIEAKLNDGFILFRPRDIVSGDFYWYAEDGNKKIIAAADCTGHGVPGAFMSLVGNTLLNKIVGEFNITVPGEILTLLHIDIINALNQSDGTNKDGMDIALCVIDYDRRVLQFAGAKNPLVIIPSKESTPTESQEGFRLIKGSKFSIGGAIYENTEVRFETHEVPFDEIAYCYIFSDGYEDQFGGSEGKKFLSRHFRRLLYEIQVFDNQKKKEILQETLVNWIGTKYKQLDDILVIGFKP